MKVWENGEFTEEANVAMYFICLFLCIFGFIIGLAGR